MHLPLFGKESSWLTDTLTDDLTCSDLIQIQKNDVIRHKVSYTDWNIATVNSRAGKNKYWWNLKSNDDERSKSVNS